MFKALDRAIGFIIVSVLLSGSGLVTGYLIAVNHIIDYQTDSYQIDCSYPLLEREPTTGVTK